jgi:pectinesterase
MYLFLGAEGEADRSTGGYARVVFQESILGSNIAAAGWEQWSSSNPNTAHAMFAEYKNTCVASPFHIVLDVLIKVNHSGAGASGTRASFSSKLSSPVKMATVLGSDKPTWVDGGFL